MGNKILYNIDYIKHEKINKQYEITIIGWCFSETTDAVNVSCRNEKFEKIDFNRYNREDVYEAYKYSDNALKSGFVLKVISKCKYKEIPLKITDNIENEINLEINIPKPEEYSIINLTNFKKVIFHLKNYGIKFTFNKIIEKIKNKNLIEESEEKYVFNEIDIPDEWIDIQKYKPLITIIVPVKNISKNKELINITLKSIEKQIYKNYEVIIITNENDIKSILECNYSHLKVINCRSEIEKDYMIKLAINSCKGDFITIIDQGDIISKNMLAHFVEEINLNKKLKIISFNEDRFIEEGDYFCPIDKNKLNSYVINGKLLYNAAFISKDLLINIDKYSIDSINSMIKDVNNEHIKYSEKFVYHKRIEKDPFYNKLKSKIIAFYLPQYHPIPENDKWWGKGFTEWTNVKRAYPMFQGHYQPREPHDEFGYYDLVDDLSIQKKQVYLAKKYNIYGFCYYYYWFNGKRLLEKPLDRILNDKSIDLPFCICWANENWTRRWDGQEREILIEQIHNDETDKLFIKDVIPILKDSRYIKINGAPLLIIYRADLFKDLKRTISTWKTVCFENGIDDIKIAIVQSFGFKNAEAVGADYAIEFPPHNLNVGTINAKIEKLNKIFKGNIYSYREVVEKSVNIKPLGYKLFRGCMLQWDNTPRRLENANIFHEFSIKDYMKWLYKCAEYVEYMNDDEDNFVFINAWNEWGEGTYLEPDKKYGYQYLEATKFIVESR